MKKPRRKFEDDEERKEAHRARCRQYRLNNLEKHKAYYTKFIADKPDYAADGALRRKYGINRQTIRDVIEVLGGCEICHSPYPKKKTTGGKEANWSVDHDHKTGKVRGILCHPCNTALGMAQDSPHILRRMADYLERNS